MSAIEKLLAVASAEVGYLEKRSNSNLYSKTGNAGSANYTKYGYEMHKLYPRTMDYPAAWCDCFVDWCFVQAFGVEKAKELLHDFDDYTVNSAAYYKLNGQWYKTPKKGDKVFFTNSRGGICHTGLVDKVSGGYVYTIEGNTSSASGVVANGGAVAKKKYPISYSRIAGYGRPDYSKVESEELTVTQYEELKKEIAALKADNLKIREIVAERTGYYNYIDNNMNESYKPTIQKLVDEGIIKGNEKGELMLTNDMMRVIVFCDRMINSR